MIDTIHDFEIIKKVFLNIYKKKKYFNFRDVENYFKSIDQNINDNKITFIVLWFRLRISDV